MNHKTDVGHVGQATWGMSVNRRAPHRFRGGVEEAVVFSSIKDDLPQFRPIIEELLKD
ncbi:MAG: hypothetical protein PUC18_06760 [Prevotellaceae bacterium]|nr:hypothetical protein [Prevotellaceae bacterium]